MTKSSITRWWLSLTFLVGYVAVFSIWTGWTTRQVIIVTTIITVVGGGGAIALGVRGRYFVNRAEIFAYACILIDVIAEAVLLIRLIEGEVAPPKPVFWLCTLAFAVVLGGYRWLRSRIPSSSRG
jgi:MFS-type transporter involved in bile tolerance (Atg22 family)